MFLWNWSISWTINKRNKNYSRYARNGFKFEYSKNYIIKNINHNFEGYVSDTLSYNSNPNGNINNYLKDRDKIKNLLAIYFDEESRERRDNYFDYINLRWQGKGSSHMYCFWKSSDNIKTLQYNNLIKMSHFLNTNPVLSLLNGKMKKNNRKN